MEIFIELCLKHHEEEESILVYMSKRKCFPYSALPVDSFAEWSLEETPKACL